MAKPTRPDIDVISARLWQALTDYCHVADGLFERAQGVAKARNDAAAASRLDELAPRLQEAVRGLGDGFIALTGVSTEISKVTGTWRPAEPPRPGLAGRLRGRR
jgi:hypothetical protein